MLYKRSAVPGWIAQLEKLFYRINSYGVLWVHQVPQLLPCQHPASSGSAGPTDFPPTCISGSPSGDRAKIQDRAQKKKKIFKKKIPFKGCEWWNRNSRHLLPSAGQLWLPLGPTCPIFLDPGTRVTEGTPHSAQTLGKPVSKLWTSSLARTADSSLVPAGAVELFKGLNCSKRN